MTDPQGCVTNLNAVAESLTGWKNDEPLGRPLGIRQEHGALLSQLIDSTGFPA